MNLCSSSFSVRDSGYILPHCLSLRAFSCLNSFLKLIAWSYSLDGGNLSATCFLNTLKYFATYSSTSSLRGISFFPWFAAMAISVNLFIFWMVVWVSHKFQIALDRLCVRPLPLTIESFSMYDMTRYGSVVVLGSPHNVPSGGSYIYWCSYIICCFLMAWSLNVMCLFCQFIRGLYILIHSILRIASSLPRSATYYLVGSLCPLIPRCPSTLWVIVPFLFILSSMSQKVRGLGNCTVGN